MSDRLVGEVWDVVGAVSAELRARFARTAEPNLGFVALATLRHLVRHGPVSVTDLARTDRVTTQAISIRVTPLLAAGLVTKSADPSDARRTILTVTTGGRDIIAAAHSDAQRALRTAVSSLNADEQAALAAALPALKRIAAHLEKESQ